MIAQPPTPAPRPWDVEVMENADKLIPRSLKVFSQLTSKYQPEMLRNKSVMKYDPHPAGVYLSDYHARLRVLRVNLREYARVPEFDSVQFAQDNQHSLEYIMSLLENPKWETSSPVTMNEVIAASGVIYQSLSIPFVSVDEVAYLLSRARVEFFDSVHSSSAVLRQNSLFSHPLPQPVVMGWGAVHWWGNTVLSGASNPPREFALCYDFSLKDESRPSRRRVDWLLWLWFGSYLIADSMRVHPGNFDGTLDLAYWQSAVQHPAVRDETNRRIAELSAMDFFTVKRFVYAGVFDPDLIRAALEQGIDADLTSSLVGSGI